MIPSETTWGSVRFCKPRASGDDPAAPIAAAIVFA